MNYQGVPKIMKIGNAKMFFTNKNPILCPIQSCSIIGWKNKTTQSSVEVSIANNFEVFSNQQNILGYKNIDFQLNCQNRD